MTRLPIQDTARLKADGYRAKHSKVLVQAKVCRHFDELARKCAGDRETGGIILGQYRGPHVEICEFTSAGPRDIRGLACFIKQDESHSRRARQLWKASGRTITNMGEWHSHPAGGVSPSFQDHQTWLSQIRLTGRPLVFVLVAPGEWGIFLGSPLTSRPTLHRLAIRQHSMTGVVFGMPPSIVKDPDNRYRLSLR
jgi:integrative and conjugative element protein (TIGR02256 family)